MHHGARGCPDLPHLPVSKLPAEKSAEAAIRFTDRRLSFERPIMSGRQADEQPVRKTGGPDLPTRALDTPEGQTVRRGMALGAILTLTLIGYGVIRFPRMWEHSSGFIESLCAGIGMATIYGLIGWFVVKLPGFRDHRTLVWGGRCGLATGLVFTLSMSAEYLIPHDALASATFGYTTFGLFFLLMAIAGMCATLDTRRLVLAPVAAAWAALIASQIWFILLLTLYYAFLDTPQEAQFLEADQVMADFQRHGARDLRTFIFEDYMGAGFFHSLLAPLIALPLGLLGGLGAICGFTVRKIARKVNPSDC